MPVLSHVIQKRTAPRLPPALLALADLIEPELAQAFLDTVLATQTRINLDDLADAIVAGDLDEAETAAQLGFLEQTLQEQLPATIRRALLRAAEVAAEVLEQELAVQVRFDLVNAEAVQYAEQEVGSRIREVARETVEAVRQIIADSVGGKVGRQDPVIASIRDVIGLRTPQIEAVQHFRDDLLADGMDPVEAELAATREAHRLLKERSVLIARTEVMDSLNAGAMASWAHAIQEGWIDPEDVTVEWIATPDEKTCPICGELDGERVAFGESWASEELGESIPRPPAHPQCLPGETHVTPGGSVTAQTERWYEGKLVVVLTANGNSLSCTPNHPILTPHGWRPACELREGDHVVRSLRAQWMPGRDHDDHDVPARIEEIARTFRRSGQVATTKVPVAPEDFHGDGVGSEVAIVSTDRLLRNRRESARCQHFPQSSLDGRQSGLPGHSGGNATALLVGPTLASGRAMCRQDLVPPLTRRHARPLDRLSIRASTDADTELEESVPQDPSAEASLVRDLLHGIAGPIAPDQVVEIRDLDWRGHVYNLETEGGWYIANGIITHNCRCTTALIPKTVAELEAERAGSQAASGHVPVTKYSQDQPRDPSGTPTGGQWTDGGGGVATTSDRPVPEHVAALLRGWTDGDYDWSDMQHAAQAVIKGLPRDQYVCYDCRGDDQTRYDNASELLRAVNGATVDRPLYRGLSRVDPSKFDTGTIFSESLTSWSGDEALAVKFSGGEYGGALRPGGTGKIVLVVVGTKMHGLAVSPHGTNDLTRGADEYLASGQYRVVSRERVEAHGGYTRVSIERIGTAQPKDLRKSHVPVVKFDPDQPRVPAGSPDGGQWVDNDGTADTSDDKQPSLRDLLAATTRNLIEWLGSMGFEHGTELGKHHRPVTRLAKYSDSQPRVPAGSPDGGQWTDGSGDAAWPRPADLPKGTPIAVEGRIVDHPEYDHRVEGIVRSGSPVLAYRGIGNIKELRDAVADGSWVSRGAWVTEWEGQTQFAIDPVGITEHYGMGGIGDNPSYGWLVATDLQGLPVIAPTKDYSKAKARSWPKLPGGRGYLISPDTGLGLGVVGSIPLDRIQAIWRIDRRSGLLEDVTREILAGVVRSHRPVVKFNPYHEPAGSAEGGQFASAPGGDRIEIPAALAGKPWVDPPAPGGKPGGQAGGYSATGLTNTEIGDLGEAAVQQLGMKSLLPPGKRQNPLDLEHSGWGFELKVLTTEADEYKMKPKAHEVQQKLRYADVKGLHPASMIGIMDLKRGRMHVYWRPGIGAFRLTGDESWNFLGVVRVKR